MAITLRNKVLEEKIKEIGRRTGLGPSAVIARAIERDEMTGSNALAALKSRREEAGRRLRSALPTMTMDDKAVIEDAAKDMFEEKTGLPKF